MARPWWRYRVWAGFTLWIGATIIDFAFFHVGAVSLGGFVLAFAWSQLGDKWEAS